MRRLGGFSLRLAGYLAGAAFVGIGLLAGLPPPFDLPVWVVGLGLILATWRKGQDKDRA